MIATVERGIYAGNGNVNAQMIRMGMAWHYKQYSDSVPMPQFEDYSRMGRFGLWSDPNPIAYGRTNNKKMDNAYQFITCIRHNAAKL